MDYQSYPVEGELEPFVKCFWTLKAAAEAEPEIQTILPDGCMEMIFQLADPYYQYPESGERFLQPTNFVFGQITRNLAIQPSGVSDIFSVRFNPEGFAPFADMEVREMNNRPVPLEELYGEAGKELAHAVLAAGSTEERIHVVSNFLLKRLNLENAGQTLSKSCVDLIIELKGKAAVGELSEQLEIHRRQLERSLAEQVGLSPKQLSRIIRLQACLRRMILEQDGLLVETAYEAEYYDQAHFIKDFKAFTGISPKAFFQDSFRMTSLFAREDWVAFLQFSDFGLFHLCSNQSEKKYESN